MRATLVCALFFSLILSGCSRSDESMEKALALRKLFSEGNGCSFGTVITADYGDKLYTFSLDCQTDRDRNLTFTVREPSTIAGITGKITDAGGTILFDDKAVAFPIMADGQITPVSAPWVFIKTLRSGYLNGCTALDNGYQIAIDDSYQSDALHLNISVNAENQPIFSEIIWQNRRILTLSVENFSFL